jgi:hypothetical protein
VLDEPDAADRVGIVFPVSGRLAPRGGYQATALIVSQRLDVDRGLRRDLADTHTQV